MPIAFTGLTWFRHPTIWSQRPTIQFQSSIRLNTNNHVNNPPLRYLDSLLAELAIDEHLANDQADLADLFAQTFLLLQRSIGLPAAFHRIEDGSASQISTVIAECHEQTLGESALRITKALFDAWLDQSGLQPATMSHYQKLRQLRTVRYPSGVTSEIIAAVERRGIPWEVVDPGSQMIDLGNGAYRTRINRTVTSNTSLFGRDLVQDKSLTNHFLRSAGVPVPAGSVVASIPQAELSANTIGYPVVIKPVDGGASSGVTVGISDAAELEEAFEYARVSSSRNRVMLEKHLMGEKYRVSIINNAIFSIKYHRRAAVVGDGQSTIQELIDRTNADPRRGPTRPFPLRYISVDDDLHRMLSNQGLDLESVPLLGKRIEVRSRARVDEGGFFLDVTDDVHPDTAEMLIQAINIIGLDVATIDFIADDISLSCWEQECGILDINVGSGFSDELNPPEGEPRDPGPAIIDMLFPPGQPVRAPITAVIGSNSAEICRNVAQRLADHGFSAGLAVDQEVVIDGVIRGRKETDVYVAQHQVLLNPATEQAVLQIDQQSFETRGLGFTYCDVAVLLSAGDAEPRVGLRTVETALLELLGDSGIRVLNLDAPGIDRYLANDATATIGFTQSPDTDLLEVVVERGGRVIIWPEATPQPQTHTSANITLMAVKPEILKADSHFVAVATLATALALEIPLDEDSRSARTI
jgi:cyanophycin synthetase